jgi:hypothetical protein
MQHENSHKRSDGVNQVEIVANHPDNRYRLGQIEIWQSVDPDEGCGLEITFHPVEGENPLPGEYAMAMVNRSDLEFLVRELTALLEETAEWPSSNS